MNTWPFAPQSTTMQWQLQLFNEYLSNQQRHHVNIATDMQLAINK